MKIKDCKGCRSEQYAKKCNTVCGVLHSCIKQESTTVKNLSMCPCVDCIVKVMCNESCRQHEQYTINLINLPDFMIGDK